TSLVDPRPDLFNHCGDLIAFCRTVIHQSFGLPFKVIFVFSSGDSRVDGYFMVAGGWQWWWL
ncbi:MAG TPA: hypothetical protein PKM01_04130, partial [Anaerolineaceae bacterium]|nr:hypothetical protein [Anaerolineaceae bacterium]